MSRAVVSVFSGFVWRVRIALSIAVADGFMPRKVRGRQKGVCQAILPKANEKPPLGLSVGGLFAYRHAPERLRSRTPWNKSSAYVSDTQSEFKRVVWWVLDRDAKRRACIVKHPPKYHLKFIPKFYVRKLNSG